MSRSVSDFYPKSESVANAALGRTLATIGYALRLRQHLAGARAGDRERESRLCNRLGQLRASLPAFSLATAEVQQVVRESVAFLREQGRTVNFTDPDPARWITQRNGLPRW